MYVLLQNVVEKTINRDNCNEIPAESGLIPTIKQVISVRCPGLSNNDSLNKNLSENGLPITGNHFVASYITIKS